LVFANFYFAMSLLRGALSLLVLAGGIGAGPGTARPAAPSVDGAPAGNPQTPAFTDTIAVNQILVPVLVRTRSGYANNLQKRDFQLKVDGRQVAIQSFDENTEAPTSLVLLQDLSGSMATNHRIERSQEVARFFLAHALPGDEFAIATFASGRGQVEVPFTTDAGALEDAVSRWEGYGTTALHDAVAWIPEISAEGHNSRRFAVLVTDGVDNSSTLSPEEAREIVRAAQVPVYVLGLDSGSPYEISSSGKKVYRYADVLNLLAGVTGGRYYSISQAGDLPKALAAIAQDLRHQYVLGFSTREGERAYRHLTVEVKAKGLGDRATVVFRRGYIGPPPVGG
jgi:Ca-activated chloride channel homolog